METFEVNGLPFTLFFWKLNLAWCEKGGSYCRNEHYKWKKVINENTLLFTNRNRKKKCGTALHGQKPRQLITILISTDINLIRSLISDYTGVYTSDGNYYRTIPSTTRLNQIFSSLSFPILSKDSSFTAKQIHHPSVYSIILSH